MATASVPTLDRAREFLSHGRIAIVGVSHRKEDFSRALMRQLVARGYDVAAVNPTLADADADGVVCHARVQDVRPPPDVAILLTSPAVTEQVVRDCAEAGVRRVWMHRGAGRGAASPAAIAFCAANGIEVVADLCPFMVLPAAGLGHRVHAMFRRRRLRRAESRV